MPYLTETEYSNLHQQIDLREHKINLLKKHGYILAMRLLQSEFYLDDDDIKISTDVMLVYSREE